MIIGSTGSVGRSAFDICMQYPDLYNIKTIVCSTNTVEATKQSLLAQPQYVIVTDTSAAKQVRDNIKAANLHDKVMVLSDNKSAYDAISQHCHIAITAIPGIDGLQKTFHAIKSCDTIAFANKETIIYAGEFLLGEAAKHKTSILPIDSEHSAIFQLVSNIDLQSDIVSNMTLTASGGPFWNKACSEMYDATIDAVLAHPTWKMGKKITVDCATMINKGLEVIEASYLFGCNIDDISVIVHPESIVHGIICLNDGTMLMHASASDMKLPIAYALSWPAKRHDMKLSIDLATLSGLHFYSPNHEKFPMMKLAIDAAKTGTLERIAMNVANEIAVEKFLQGEIKFGQIYEIVNDTLQHLKVSYNITDDIDDHITQVSDIYSQVREKIHFDFIRT